MVPKTTRPGNAPCECRECYQMIHGLEGQILPFSNDNELIYLFGSDLMHENNIINVFNINNIQIIHNIHETLKVSDNLFNQFDVLFDKYFKNKQPKRQLLQLQLFEKLYLRAVALITDFQLLTDNKIPCYTIKNMCQTNFNIHLGIVSASILDSGISKDLPMTTDFLVSCANTEFQNFVLLSFLYFNTKMHIIQEHLVLRYLCGKIRSMFELTKDSPDFLINRRNIAFNYLTHLQFKLNSKLASTESQRIQIFELCGNSGAGKSQAAQNLKYLVKAIVKHIPMRDIVYTRANDYWWNGYCGQPILLYDDLTHIKKKLKFDLAFEIIAVASGTFRNPPMAFDKNMPFTSSLAILTSNIPLITTVADAETATALKRRIISQKWKPIDYVQEQEDGTYKYNFNGLLINSIWSNRSIFSVFGEVLDIISSSNNLSISFLDDNESIILDEEKEENPVFQIPFTTSSVAKSPSEILQSIRDGTLRTWKVTMAPELIEYLKQHEAEKETKYWFDFWSG